MHVELEKPDNCQNRSIKIQNARTVTILGQRGNKASIRAKRCTVGLSGMCSEANSGFLLHYPQPTRPISGFSPASWNTVAYRRFEVAGQFVLGTAERAAPRTCSCVTSPHLT